MLLLLPVVGLLNRRMERLEEWKKRAHKKKFQEYCRFFCQPNQKEKFKIQNQLENLEKDKK